MTIAVCHLPGMQHAALQIARALGCETAVVLGDVASLVRRQEPRHSLVIWARTFDHDSNFNLTLTDQEAVVFDDHVWCGLHGFEAARGLFRAWFRRVGAMCLVSADLLRPGKIDLGQVCLPRTTQKMPVELLTKFTVLCAKDRETALWRLENGPSVSDYRSLAGASLEEIMDSVRFPSVDGDRFVLWARSCDGSGRSLNLNISRSCAACVRDRNVMSQYFAYPSPKGETEGAVWSMRHALWVFYEEVGRAMLVDHAMFQSYTSVHGTFCYWTVFGNGGAVINQHPFPEGDCFRPVKVLR